MLIDISSKRWIVVYGLLFVTSVQQSYGVLRLANMSGATVAKKGAAAALAVQMRHLVPGQEKHPFWIKISDEIKRFDEKHGITPTDDDLKKMIDKHPGITPTDDDLKKMIDKHPGFIDWATARLKEAERQLSLPIISEETSAVQKVRALSAQIFEKHGITHGSVVFLAQNINAATGMNTLAFVDIKNVLYISPMFMALETESQQRAILEHEVSHIRHNDNAKTAWVRNHLQLNQDAGVEFQLLQEQRADIHSGIQGLENAQALPQTYAELMRVLKAQTYLQNGNPEQAHNLLSGPNYMEELIAYMKQHNG